MFYLYVDTQTHYNKTCCYKNHGNICSLLKSMFVPGFNRKISPARFSWCSLSSESIIYQEKPGRNFMVPFQT